MFIRSLAMRNHKWRFSKTLMVHGFTRPKGQNDFNPSPLSCSRPFHYAGAAAEEDVCISRPMAFVLVGSETKKEEPLGPQKVEAD